MAVNLALSATRRLANRVSLCSELSAARRSLWLSEICSIPIALSATRRSAKRVSLSSELSAARRSLLLRSLASSLVWIHDESLTNCKCFYFMLRLTNRSPNVPCCMHVYVGIYMFLNERWEGRKKEASKIKQTNKAEQHSTPKADTFPRNNELPQVGLEPTTVREY